MIYAVYGQIGSGKDTFADFVNSYNRGNGNQEFEIKKFADEIKNTLCRWLGCTREQLEDRDFKEKDLGPEWWYHIHLLPGEKNYKEIKIPYVEGKNTDTAVYKHTPRSLLQLLGTDCGRNILHPNIWCNILMSQYRKKYVGGCDPFGPDGTIYTFQKGFPNWIITDLRFDNEMDAVQDRKGITIKVLRKFGLKFPEYAHLEDTKDSYGIPAMLRVEDFDLWMKLTHESEISLLHREDFDYVIYNDGTLEDYKKEVIKIIKNHEG